MKWEQEKMVAGPPGVVVSDYCISDTQVEYRMESYITGTTPSHVGDDSFTQSQLTAGDEERAQ